MAVRFGRSPLRTSFLKKLVTGKRINRPGRDRAFALSPSYRRVPAPPGLQELPPPKNDDAMLRTTRARPRPCGGGALLPLRASGGNGRAGNGEGRTFLHVAQTGVVHS
eukprot:tig00000842_g4829.t1